MPSSCWSSQHGDKTEHMKELQCPEKRVIIKCQERKAISWDRRSTALFPNMVFSLMLFFFSTRNFSTLIMWVRLEEFTFGTLNGQTANPFHKTHFWESPKINVYSLCWENRTQWNSKWFKHDVPMPKKQCLTPSFWPSFSQRVESLATLVG